MAVWEEDQLEELDPREQLKVLIELRHRLQTLVSLEVWEELCEIGKGQISNLMKEAEALPYGLDAMLCREAIRARADGVRQILETPQAFIEDLTNTIETLNAEISPQESEE